MNETETNLVKRKRKKSLLTQVDENSDKEGSSSSSMSDVNSGEDVSEDEWKFSTKKTRSKFMKRLTKQTLKSKLAEKTRNLRMISKVNNSCDKSSTAAAAAAAAVVGKCETPLLCTSRLGLNVKPESELFDSVAEKEETTAVAATVKSDISGNATNENNVCSLKKEKDVTSEHTTVSTSDLPLKKENAAAAVAAAVIKEEKVSTCKEPIVINYSMIATADQQQTLDTAAISSSSTQQCVVVAPLAKNANLQQQQQSFISDSAKRMAVSPFLQTCSSQNSAISSSIPISPSVFQPASSSSSTTSIVSNKLPPPVPVSPSSTAATAAAAAAAATFLSPLRSGNVTPTKTNSPQQQQQNAYISNSTSGQMIRVGYSFSPSTTTTTTTTTTPTTLFSNKKCYSPANRVRSPSSFVRTPSPCSSVFTSTASSNRRLPPPAARKLFSPAVATGKLRNAVASSPMKSKPLTPSPKRRIGTAASSLPTTSRQLTPPNSRISSSGVTRSSSSSSSSSQRKKAGAFLNKIGNISPNGTVIHTGTGSVTITPRKLPPERPPVQRKLFKNEIEGSISCRSENGMLRYVVNLANGTHIPLSTVQVQKLREQNNGTLPVKLRIPVPSDVADKIEPSFVIED